MISMNSNRNSFLRKHIKLLVAAISSVLPAIAAPGITEVNLHKSFEVAPGGKLVMDVRIGEIEITGSKQNTVTIDVIRKVTVLDSEDNSDEQKEQELLRQNEIAF